MIIRLVYSPFCPSKSEQFWDNRKMGMNEQNSSWSQNLEISEKYEDAP